MTSRTTSQGPPLPLSGKIAVVTGSTQGLGEATARLFAARGCSGLVLTGRNRIRGEALAEELSSKDCRALFVEADLASVGDCRRLMRAADDAFGRLDVLVNAAGTTDRGSLWDTTPEDYDRIMAVNARAPFFLMQDAARIMERESTEGSIVNVSSTASYGSMPMLAAYGMSKAALNASTKNAAYSLAWSRIRVNALAIGWMDTPGEEAAQKGMCMPNGHKGGGQGWRETAGRGLPFGRLLRPEEVARCIAFCASDESGMMTGCVIDFDQSVWGAGNPPVPPRKEEWDRASGMTFSFEGRDRFVPVPAAEQKAVKKAAEKAAVAVAVAAEKSPPAPPTPAPAPAPAPASKPAGRRAGSKSPGRLRWPPPPPVAKDVEPESYRRASEVFAAAATPATQDNSNSNSKSENYGYDNNGVDTSSQASIKEPTAASETASDASTGASPTPTPTPPPPEEDAEDAAKDDARDAAKEAYFSMRTQRMGDVYRPDEYLPGTEPSGYFVPTSPASRRKKKAGRKWGGNPDCHGKSRVDEWLGSGVAPKLTYRVKPASR